MTRIGGAVQITVNMEVKGSSEEIQLFLMQMAIALVDEDLEEKAEADWWTPETAAAFVGGLTDPALRALRLIAEHAPSASFAELKQEMGVTGSKLAGRLSSIGFAVARLDAPSPFYRDPTQQAYLMDEQVAAVLREAVAEEFTRRANRRVRR